jgi:PAS domain S-box-containing protein
VENTETISFDPTVAGGSSYTHYLELLLNNTEENFILADRDLKVLAFNKAAAQRAGQVAGVKLRNGMSVLEIALPERQPVLAGIYAEVLRGQTHTSEFRFARPEGDIWFENYIKPIYNDQRSVVMILVIIRDITGRKKAERAQRESEQLWRFALEGTNQGVWDWKIQEDLVYFSEGWSRLFGFASEEMPATMSAWKARLHPDDQRAMEQNITTHLTGDNNTYESTFRFKAKDGSYKWILSRGLITEWTADGRPGRMIGTHTDISERKKVEENYRFLFYNNPLPMWTFERTTGCFIEVNNAAVAHYGYSREEFLQMTIFDIRPPEVLDAFVQDRSAQLGSETIPPRPYQHRKKDGSLIWANVTGEVFRRDGRTLCLVLAEDVTEKIVAEQKLKESEEQYKSLFAHHPLPSFIMDDETLRFLEVNNAIVAAYGYTREELLGMSALDINLPESHDFIRSHTGKDLQSHFSAKEWKHVKKDGELIIADVEVTMIQYRGRRARLVVANDITEKVKAEKELKRSNERFELAGRATSDAIYDLNLLKNQLTWGEGMFTLFGWTGESVTFERWDELLHPDDRERISASLKNTLSQPDSTFWRDEYYFRHTDGSYRYVLDRCYVIRNSRGEAVRLIGAMQDITMLKQKEQELSAINQRFTLAAKATSEILWEADLEGQGMYLSPAFTEIFGLEVQPDVYFRNWPRYIHPEDLSPLYAQFLEALKDPRQLQGEFECRHMKSDGSFAYIINHCIFERNAAGRVVKIVGAIRDISKRRLAEEETRISNERFQFAARATFDIIWDWEIGTDRVLWSENLNRVFGWPLPEDRYLELQFTVDNTHPDDFPWVMASFEKALADKTVSVWEEEFRFRKADGSYAYISDRGFIIRNEEGTAIRLIGAVRDITAVKRKEKELEESNERYQYVTRATSDIVWDWDIAQNTVLWSDNYTRLFGWKLPADKLLSIEELSRLTHPEDVEKLISSTSAALADPQRTIWEDEFRFRKADGTYAYVTDKGFIIRDAAGNAIRIIGVMQDITDRKYHQDLLALERTIFELSNDPKNSFTQVINHLLRGIEQVHPKMLTSVLLLKPDQSIMTVAAPRLPQEYLSAINGVKIGSGIGSCGTAMYEKRNVIVPDIGTDPLWKDFKGLALSFNLQACWSVPIIDREGHVLGSFAIYHNSAKQPNSVEMNTIERIRNILRILMENHFALRKIKIFNDRYNNILKATHDCIWDWNLETGTFYRNEEGISKVYGVKNNQAIQNIYSWMQRIHPEDNTRVQRVINDILHATDRDTFDVEYRFKRDDGDYSYIYDRGIIVRDADGKPVRMIGAAQNVTERKKLQMELLQQELDRQKLISQATIDTQEQERSEIGKELHDNVNQILTTTKLYLDLSLSNPELKDELIQKSSKNIIYVINEIRQLSRSLMNPSIGDLGLVDSIHDLVENINVTRKLQVSLTADEAVEELLSENQKLMVFRIIQEALNNSIKHAQAGSVIIFLKKGRTQVHLDITDDGVGFNPSTVKKGAGLKNIQNRVYLTNGKLNITSAPTKGCKIEISFPINKK